MRAVVAVCVAALLMSCGGERPRSSPHPQGVTIARSGQARARIVVVTQGVAIKETGPAETIKKFGEVYAFVPQTLIVRLDEPTQIEFWNLQADDSHDFMLTDPRNKVLLKMDLAPLSKTIFVMTFHEEGRFPFYCAMHQPAMSGQILVIGPGPSRQQ